MSAVILIVSLLFIGFIFNSIFNFIFGGSKNEVLQSRIQLTEKGEIFFNELVERYNNGETLTSFDGVDLFKELFPEYDKLTLDPTILGFSENIIEKHSDVTMVEKVNLSDLTPEILHYDYMQSLIYDMGVRERLSKKEFKNQEEARKRFNIIIDTNEKLFNINKLIVDLYQEKTTVVGRNYSGYKWSSGGNSRFVMGSLRSSPITTTDFKLILQGFLYVTDKKLYFIGVDKNFNKTININKIVSYELFNDGVLIKMENGGSFLIKINATFDPTGMPNHTPKDHLRRLMLMLDNNV